MEGSACEPPDATSFTRFHAAAGDAALQCGLLTGRYPVRCGVVAERGGIETLASNETTVARVLRASGYRTGFFGKWRLGNHYPYLPHGHGFDDFVGRRSGPNARAERNGAPYTLRDSVADEAVRFLDARHDPFFLYVADPACTPLLAKLVELGLAENTIAILAGARSGGSKTVRFWMRWPGQIAAGRQVDRAAGPIDLYPTLLELCHAPQPDDAQPIDGRSLIPLLGDARGRWPDRLLFEYSAVRQAVITQRLSLVNGRELYDLEADPEERQNVAAEHPEHVSYLHSVWEAWLGSAVPRGGVRRLPIPVGYPEENPVRLGAGEADGNGWDLDVVRAGRYEVAPEMRVVTWPKGRARLASTAADAEVRRLD